MLEKVLIAEDHESSNSSLRKALDDFGVPKTDHVFYCDDAMSRILGAIKSGEPYDLLISDLSFQDDGIPQKIGDGIELIRLVKAEQPGIRIIVFSAENKTAVIDNLFKNIGIDAFVQKARGDVGELRQALEAVKNRRKYLSHSLRRAVKENNSYEFKEYDITLIKLLSSGMLQKEIPSYLSENGIRPSGLSSVEKRLNNMREALSFTKNEQLIAFCKDIGVI